MKHDLTYNYTDNIMVDTLVFVNNQTSGFLIYAIVMAFFIVLTYVFIKRTDDVPLSMIRSLFATTMISTIIYYMGKNYNLNLFNGSFLITMMLVLTASIGILYYQRHQVH